MSVSAARAELGKALQTALGKSWSVFPQPEGLDEITKPTLHLVRTRVAKLPEAPLAGHLDTFSLFVIVPRDSGEDELDERLEQVLDALDFQTGTRWEDAERTVYGAEPGNPAYLITLTTHALRATN